MFPLILGFSREKEPVRDYIYVHIFKFYIKHTHIVHWLMIVEAVSGWRPREQLKLKSE